MKTTLNCGVMLWVARPLTNNGGGSGGGGGGGAGGEGELFVLDFIAERKSLQDLLSSITTDRYAGQKVNMKGAGVARLLYLLEGSPEALPEGEGGGRRERGRG